MASVRAEAGENPALSGPLRQTRRLLRMEGGDFVREAYRIYLGREADPAGIGAYAPRAGHLPGRITILAALALSPERVCLPGWLRASLRIAARACRRSRKEDSGNS